MRQTPVVWIPGLLFAFTLSAAAGSAPIVGKGRAVTIEYTMYLTDGREVDSNVGGEPLVYEYGSGEFPPAMEEALSGSRAGDVLEFTLPPEQAFGKVEQEAIQEIDVARLPENARQEGAALVISNEEGQERVIRVRKIDDGKAVIDFNHPLAGEIIHFKVKVLSVK